MAHQRLNHEAVTVKTLEGSIIHLRTSIADLPFELLSIIFKFAHENMAPIQREKDIIPTWMRMEGPEGFKQSVMALVHPTIPENPKSPTLFPYSLAAVCSFWRDVLCAHPEFWTLVVLFIDSRPTPLVDASLFLKWSRKLDIDVFITRRDQLRPKFHPDLHEKCQIDALLRILKPHVHRCRSLHVDAHLSSSFPIIHKTFKGIEAPNLKSMEFVCDTYAFPDDEDEGASDDDLGFDFEPNLSHLIIDGDNFRRTSEDLSSWMDSLKQLTIGNYEQNDGYCLEDVLEFLENMPWLNQLKFDSLQLDFLHTVDPDRESIVTTPYIHLQDVNEDFVEDLFTFVDFDAISVLRITRCPLPDLYDFDGIPETLILEDINSDIDILGAITTWAGEYLWLDRCHSFSGAFLKALGHRHLSVYPCNEMSRLLLYRLPKFPILVLKKMIQKRNRDVSYSDPNWKTATEFGPAISHLAVVHCDMGKLSVKTEKWFRSRLVEFYWSSFPSSLNISITDYTKSSPLKHEGVLATTMVCGIHSSPQSHHSCKDHRHQLTTTSLFLVPQTQSKRKIYIQ